MRDIKFRAWHNPTNKYVVDGDIWHPILGKACQPVKVVNHGILYVDPYNKTDIASVTVTLEDGKTTKLYSSWDSEEIVSHEVVIEQYTGQIGENGTDIYEGDIVKCGSNNHVGIVVFNVGMSCFDVDGFYNTSFDWCGAAFSEDQSLEVLGNIHETPKLIGGDA